MSRGPLADVSTAADQGRRGGASRPSWVPALTIISHPYAQRAGDRLLLDALSRGHEVAISRNAPDFARPGSALGAPLGDPFVSRRPIRIAAGTNGRIRLLVEDGGTQVVVGTQVRGGIELDFEAITAGVPIELADRVTLLLHLANVEAGEGQDRLGMVGESAALWRVRGQIERIVDLNVPVLIRGETGTGKELVARAIHEHSPRKERPFVSVNLGAIPRELAAAELFGTQKGAYTGATRDREGFFRVAASGTLFLDEVGEAPPEVQVMLLRVLETQEMYPVGATSPVHTDVRLIAATDADLEAHIREGQFKAPLLHRLAGYEIALPPLRERREDIGLLFYHFARESLQGIGEGHLLSPQDPYAEPWLSARIAGALVRHVWPGNIRQLKNLAQQLVIGSRGKKRLDIDPRVEKEILTAAAPILGLPCSTSEPAEERRARRRPSEVTEEELVAALREHAWDLKAAADRLGIPRSSIYELIEKSTSIRTAGDLKADEITACYQECKGDLDAMVQRLQVSKRALGRRIRELGLGGGRA